MTRMGLCQVCGNLVMTETWKSEIRDVDWRKTQQKMNGVKRLPWMVAVVKSWYSMYLGQYLITMSTKYIKVYQNSAMTIWWYWSEWLIRIAKNNTNTKISTISTVKFRVLSIQMYSCSTCIASQGTRRLRSGKLNDITVLCSVARRRSRSREKRKKQLEALRLMLITMVESPGKQKFSAGNRYLAISNDSKQH